MPSVSEYNQFRRLIGKDETFIADLNCDSYLDDACRELTQDFKNGPVTDFDTLVQQYHPEVIYRAAINWWWEYASQQTTKHNTTVGSASQDEGERWDRAMQMIERLETRFDSIQTLGTDITMGNLSRWDRTNLRRIGGESEEDAAL